MPLKMIFEDSRQQSGKHDNINIWLQAHGIELRRTKLFVGDYTLPTDQTVCIDTKFGLQEVYGNLIQQHTRFINECKAAHDAGIRLIVLVEQPGIRTVQDVAKWINPRIAKWERLRDAHRAGKRMNEKLSPYPPASSERLSKAMQTVSERYGIEWAFCCKEDTARRICEFLGLGVE